jgi:gpW
MAIDQDKLQSRLEQAEDALHRLMTGDLEVKVEYDGGSTEYNRANIPELRRYIRSLKSQLGQPVNNGSRKVMF